MRNKSRRNLDTTTATYSALIPQTKEEEKIIYGWDDIDYLDQVLSPRTLQLRELPTFEFNGGPPLNAQQIEKERREQELESYRLKIKQLRKKKTNSKCADCITRYPPYTVINFGTFICAKCSMHHKKLGHRVKSINLDDFNKKEVELFIEIGNKNSNKKYLTIYDQEKEYTEDEQYEFIKKKYKGTKRKSKKHKQNKTKYKVKPTPISIPDGIFAEYDPFKNNDIDTDNNHNDIDTENSKDTDSFNDFDGALCIERTNNMMLQQSETTNIAEDTNQEMVQNQNLKPKTNIIHVFRHKTNQIKSPKSNDQTNIVYDINDNDDPFDTQTGDNWDF